ncbi:alpha/beta fold hydrolase [Bacillus sp. SG-1]|uniref:alpha/beta fold hydrolase n=1 Tax=Bacillus sp. SG-1 TaxID=161544 RepID=UPI00015434BA|nr:alpha/beta hydrolase [Bacillus sp. SG-1]EDL66316.1 hydrolase, alpha/beta fold family protein [Bacillus sp. SG-1]
MKPGKLINIRGKDLYVEVYGASEKDAILYLHGGPGESCYDFSVAQAEKLAENFMVVAIDQRGVCRSEGIGPDETFGLMDIIHDCEALRNQLDISKWSLIGHSFGGFLSVLYASEYPASIHKIILEGPTFDFQLTSRNLLRKTASLLTEAGNEAAAKDCLSLADTKKPMTIRELTEKYMEFSDLLGEERMKIYRYDLDSGVDYSFYTDEEWELFFDRSEVHYNRLREEGQIFKSLLPALKELPHEMLLLMGESDPVPCNTQVAVFKEAENASIYTVENCGHTPHYETPDKFTRIVNDFLGCSVLNK